MEHFQIGKYRNMDLSGLVDGGVFVPIAACIAVVVVIVLVASAIRRSTARMAEDHNQWINELPSSTRARQSADEQIDHLTR